MITMSVWLDEKYVNMVSYKLDRFKKRGPYLWNFRCVLCGDSKKDKTKTRGYIYKKKDYLFFHCHNCHETMFFGQLLKRLDVNLHRQYSLESFAETPRQKEDETKSFTMASPKFSSKKINLPSIESLPFDHFAKKYILSRKLPREFLGDIYYSGCFKSFVDEIQPENEKNIPPLEKRIIIPFYDEDKNLLGFQGRALFESKLKYITIMLDDTYRKIFGLDKVDLNKPILVVEGPFDSKFLYNAIATMDSALFRVAEVLGQDREYVFLYDNEKRNPQVCSNMEKTIKLSHKIFIWPRTIAEKDINEMVINGKGTEEIMAMINKHTYQDMDAMLRMTMWRK